jgi:PKD repeat protein
MTRIFTENFEGGTVGGTLQGFTAFNAEPATGATFINNPVAVGTRAAQITTPATAASRPLSYNLGSLQSVLYSAVYIYLTANPSAVLFLGGVNAAGVARASWRINTDGTFSLRNNVTAIYTSTATVPLNQWVRVEWRIDGTAAQQQMRVYPQHSATALFDSGPQLYDMGTFDTFLAGITIAIANTTVNLDWVALDNATWVGPGVAAAVPVSSFSFSPTTGTAPLTVNFTGTSSGSPTAWAWNFGDGATATTQNPTHTYNAAGTYTVTLTASNASGTGNTVTQTVVVTDPTTTGGMHLFMASGGAWVALTEHAART